MSDFGVCEILQHPTTRQLLNSATPAHLAFVARDGSPRVTPI